jgi:hypothetical protein
MTNSESANGSRQDNIDQDRDRIDVSDAHECQFWLEKLGLTYPALKTIVAEVGPMVKDVRKHLAKRKGAV